MLYTSYLANINKLPKDSIKLIVTRYPPKDLNVLKYNKLHLVRELSPEGDLLNNYNKTNKTNEDWKEFVLKFNNQLSNDLNMQLNIQKIIRGLQKNIDIILICYEKNYNQCHRKLIAEYIKNNYGYDWKEF